MLRKHIVNLLPKIVTTTVIGYISPVLTQQIVNVWTWYTTIGHSVGFKGKQQKCNIYKKIDLQVISI